jgi:hypothetical protein
MNNCTCSRVMAVIINITYIMYDLRMFIRYVVSIRQVPKDAQFGSVGVWYGILFICYLIMLCYF